MKVSVIRLWSFPWFLVFPRTTNCHVQVSVPQITVFLFRVSFKLLRVYTLLSDAVPSPISKFSCQLILSCRQRAIDAFFSFCVCNYIFHPLFFPCCRFFLSDHLGGGISVVQPWISGDQLGCGPIFQWLVAPTAMLAKSPTIPLWNGQWDILCSFKS